MSKPENPALIEDGDSDVELRDLFAAAALSGLLARAYTSDIANAYLETEAVARAFQLADLMLAEREKRS